jgi:hypothetical protein
VAEWLGIIERWWHDKRMAWALPLGASLWVLAYLSDWGGQLTVPHTAAALAVGLLAAGIWHGMHLVPRTRKGRVGLVIAIVGDDLKHDEQIRSDFVESLRKMIEIDQRRTFFQLVVFPRFLAERCQSSTDAARYLTKTKGHFMIFGSARVRSVSGAASHVLSLEGIVGHAPVPAEVSAQLSSDFKVAIPRRVTFPRDNDVFSFEFTSAWTETAARYIIGLAALVSGDVQYSETLLLSAEQRLRQSSKGPFRKLAEDLPSRLIVLYQNWMNASHDAYVASSDKRYLEIADEVATKLLARDSSHYGATLMKGICAFTLRRDIGQAKHHVRAAKRLNDVTWRYSLGFLYAYEGRMKESRTEYAKAFAGQLNDVTVPVQCDLFIQSVLAEEPERGQLHFAAALINQHVKPDSTLAISEYESFLAHPCSTAFPEEVTIANSALMTLRKEQASEATRLSEPA